MKVGVKLAILPAMMLIPLAYVGTQYVSVQNHSIQVAQRERRGVAYLRPSFQLLLDVDRARDDAVSGTPIDGGAISSDLDRLDALTPSYSEAMPALPGAQPLTAALSQTHTALATASSLAAAATPDQVLSAWNAASSAVANLILQDSNDSTLVLDPQLDSYYTMDAVMNRASALVDQAGQLAGAGLLAARHPGGSGAGTQVSQAVILGGVDSAYAALASDLSVAFQSTKLAGLQHSVSAPAAAVASTQAALDRATTSRTADWTGIDGRAQAAVAALAPLAMTGLDAILAARISGFQHSELTAALVALIALLAGLGFFAFVWRTVMGPLLGLRDRMQDIATGEGDLTARLDATSGDEIGDLGRAFNRFIERIQGVMVGFSESIVALLSASEALGAITVDTGDNADRTATTAAGVSSAANQVATNITAVAAGAEQMGASIREIARNASNAAEVAATARRRADEANARIQSLAVSADEIGGVVHTISGIAAQTSLLALNATIEAARAGDAGKGFAVVASEVKDLAGGTATATDDITARVSAIQGSTTLAVEAIADIAAVIEEISSIQGMIAAAVEQQNASTLEIGRWATEVAGNASEITTSISGVAQAVTDTSVGVASSSETIGELARLSDSLSALISQFKIA